MDFVSRAKALLKKQVATAALVIVPLAAAVSAQAAVNTLPTSNYACTTQNSTTGPTCSGGVAQLPNPGNGLMGVEFFTIGSVTFNTAISGGGTGQVFMQTSGTQLAGFSGTMPLAYDFTLSGNITSWTLGYSVSQASGLGVSGFVNVPGTGSGQHTGTADFPNPVTLVAGGFTNVNFLLTVNYTGSGASVTIPQNSIDFNVAASTVPEPGTTALIGLGLAMAGGLRLVRRRNRFFVIRSKE